VAEAVRMQYQPLQHEHRRLWMRQCSPSSL
jgi:hypothetical protein